MICPQSAEANSVFEKILNGPQKMCYAPSLASNNAQDRMFIDSSEVEQHVTALWRAMSLMLPQLHVIGRTK
jgi:DNA-binding transcriptional regulator LsrR (DeoR family)